MTSVIPAALIFAPLSAALLAWLSPRLAPVLTFAVVAGGCAGTLLLFAQSGAEPWTMALGGWATPLGISWRLDGLGMTLLTLTWVLALAVTVYARAYFSGQTVFWPLWLLMLSGLSALFVANDLFNIYVMLEILGLASVALVTLANRTEALRAALTYLFVTLSGSLAYLAGVAVLYMQYATLDISLLGAAVNGNALDWTAMLLMAAGLLLKSAVFPLHFWLPRAHANAPAPVSVILSALVVKASLYLLMRLWRDVAPAQPEVVAWLLGALGAVAIIWGSVQALRTPRLKVLVAYSTVAQLGYVMLLFPLSLQPASAAIAYAGVVYFICAHGLAKAALFMAAGNLQRLAGHDEIKDLHHAAAALQPTIFAVALAGASLMGLPPSGGFIAKWTLLGVSLENGAWIWVVVLLAGGLLSVAYIFRILVLSFRDDAIALQTPAREQIPVAMQYVPLALGVFTVVLGFNAMPVISAVMDASAALAGAAP